MVGPVDDEERRTAWRRLGVGFAAFVGLSAALMAFHGGATPVEVALVALVGVLVGVALLAAMGARLRR